MTRKILNDSNIVDIAGLRISIYNALKRCCARSGRYLEKFSKPIWYGDRIIVTNTFVMVEVDGFRSRYPSFCQIYNDDMRADADLVRSLHDRFLSNELRVDESGVDESVFIVDAKYLKQVIGVFSALKCADNISMSYDSEKRRMMFFAESPIDDNIEIKAILQTKRRNI